MSWTPKVPVRRDPNPATELLLQYIAGNLTFTRSTVTAWFTLPERVWAFTPDGKRETFLTAVAEQYAGLAGYRLHLRRTTTPYDTGSWAGNLFHSSNPVGHPKAFEDHIFAAADHINAANPVTGLTMLGVEFARRTFGDLAAGLIRARLGKANNAERTRLQERVDKLAQLLTPFGLHARPSTPVELSWLVYRSVGLGLTPPDRRATSVGPGDVLALTEHVDRYRSRYGSTVRLIDRLTGEESHVAVLTFGRMEPIEVPQRHDPWLHMAGHLQFPVELSSRVDVLNPAQTAGSMGKRLLMIRSQELHYDEHGIDSPPELARLGNRALHVGDEIATGRPVDAVRVHGWHRLAVFAPTERETLDRAAELARFYEQEIRATVQHPKNQAELAREFIPGEPLANTGYVRRMPVKMLAAAVPQAKAEVGDRRGDLIGFVAAGDGRPVMFDAHYPMEVRERGGVSVLVAEPGGGKSTLMGAIGYLAARRGVRTTLLDPSGPLARLASMPQLRGYAKVVNLVGSQPGTLAPYALVPTPHRTQFAPGEEGDQLFEIEVTNARAERRMLVQDIATMLLPPQVARQAATAAALRHAVRRVPQEETSTLDDLAQALLDAGDVDAKEAGELLLDAREMPLARLLFGRPPAGTLTSDAPLTVITMAGLRLPDMTIERELWSAEEAMALPMLHLAHRLAVRRCYGGDMHARKLVGLDEAHLLEGWRSGRAFMIRLARDSRKWNLAALVASQNPKDILSLDVQNLVTTVFVGLVAEDGEVAADALRLLRLPAGAGYEEILASLSRPAEDSTERLGYREFVMRDIDGRVQKIRVDLSYAADLLTHLNTTPGGTR